MFHRNRVLTFSIGAILLLLVGAGLVLGLLIPAMQSARETARLNQCAKNLMEMAQAAQKYEENQGGMPPMTSNDAGFYASWAALVAPYVEKAPSLDLAQPGNRPQNLGIIEQYNSPVWQCPSRRAGQVYNFAASFSNNPTGVSFDPSQPTDYAPGHSTTAELWNTQADGLVINPLEPAPPNGYPVPALHFDESDIPDGVSHTAVLGEKHMRPSWLGSTISASDQRGLDIPLLLAADSPASIRLAGDRLGFGTLPLAPHPEWGKNDDEHAPWAFGSWHRSRSQFALADSAVREYSVETDPVILRHLISRLDGLGSAVEAGDAVEPADENAVDPGNKVPGDQ